MTKLIISLLLLNFSASFAQDWSSIGKKIPFSDTLQKAVKYTNIDKALENPDKVYYLDIYGDQKGENIKKFSANALKFKNLRKLILMNRIGPMINLSDSIWSLKKLEYLDLFNFPNFSTAGIKHLTQLKYLALDGFGFKEVPAEILELEKLEYLNLSCNFLSALPDSIGKLKNLKEMELTNNCFTKIPVELVQLKMLAYITINNAEQGAVLADGKVVCDNSISEFPTVLQEIKDLKKVNCFFKINIDGEMKKKIRSTYPKIKFS